MVFYISISPQMSNILLSVFSKASARATAVVLYMLNYLHASWIAIDNAHRISDDWYIIPYFVKAVCNYGYYLLSHKLNYWYIFEHQVHKQTKRDPNKLALVYVSNALDKKLGPKVDSNFIVEKYSYQQLYDIILRLSYILVNQYNIKPGDTIGVAIHNKPIFLFYWFALWNIGAKPAFINYNVNSHPLAHSIKVASISQLFIDEETKNTIYYDAKTNQPTTTHKLIKQELPQLELQFINEQEIIDKTVNDLNAYKFRLPDTLRNRDDKPWSAGCYIFTSGTTGLPKAAIMSWRKIDLGTSLYGRIVRITQDSTVFTAMPLYHSTAGILGLLPTWSQGGCIAITDKFSASNYWTQVKLSKASHIQYVGEICRYLLNRPEDPQYEQNHRVQVAYGNGLRKDIWQNFKQRFNIAAIGEFFASTEAPIATTSFQVGNFGIGACRNYGTIINYILSFQQRLVKMDNDEIYRDPKTGLCREPEVDEPGQLLFRITRPKKPYVDFQGYVNDHQETNNKIIRDVYKRGDCWMKTGDLIKQDKYGLFYFIDRLGDTYRWKSENVSTNEVEMQLIYSNLFENAIVVGLKLENYEGRAGYAVAKPKNPDLILNSTSKQQLDELLQELSSYISANLPKYSIPVFLKLVHNFKTTDTHKIVKYYYKNEVLPRGRDGNETIYWFNGKKYEELTEEVWEKIKNQQIRL